jgi:hypothetical protein
MNCLAYATYSSWQITLVHLTRVWSFRLIQKDCIRYTSDSWSFRNLCILSIKPKTYLILLKPIYYWIPQRTLQHIQRQFCLSNWALNLQAPVTTGSDSTGRRWLYVFTGVLFVVLDLWVVDSCSSGPHHQWLYDVLAPDIPTPAPPVTMRFISSIYIHLLFIITAYTTLFTHQTDTVDLLTQQCCRVLNAIHSLLMLYNDSFTYDSSFLTYI